MSGEQQTAQSAAARPQSGNQSQYFTGKLPSDKIHAADNFLNIDSLRLLMTFLHFQLSLLPVPRPRDGFRIMIFPSFNLCDGENV